MGNVPTRDFLDGPPWIGRAAPAVTDFSTATTFDPPALYVWIEVPTQGEPATLVCEFIDDEPGVTQTLELVQTREYPFEVRRVLPGSTIAKIVPCYPRGFRP